MKKEKTVRTYQRRTKSGKMVTVREHKASYDAAEEARKAAAKKAGAGSELSKKKAVKEENPLGFSEADYKEWYHWDMENDANNEAALRVEKALTKKMGKKAYNKYLEDMSNSYTARGHKKAHQALLDEHTASQKKQDVESAKTAKDIARGAKDKSSSAKKPTSTKASTTSTTGDGADWSKATVDKIDREYGGGYTIVGTPNDSLWSSTNFRTKSQALDFIKRKQKESSAKSEKATSTESKGHPKVISRIDKLISSYQRDIEEAQKHIDAGEKGSGRLTYWREKKKNYEKAIAKLEKGREYHLSGKENQAWKALGDFVGFNKNHIISKETRTKNEVAKEKKRQKTEEQRIKAAAEAHAKDIARVAISKESKSRRSSTPKTSESYATLKQFEGAPYRMRISKNGDPMPGEKQKLAKWKAGNKKLKKYLSTPEGAADKESYVSKQKEKERKAEERRKRDVAKWREKYTAEKKAKKEKFTAKVSELKGKGFKTKKRVITKYASSLKGVDTALNCFVSPDRKSAYVYRSGDDSPTLRKATAKELKIIIGESKAKKPTKMR